MIPIKRSSYINTLASLLALGLVIAPPTLVLAQPIFSSLSSKIPKQWDFDPPVGDAPYGRDGGATRSPCNEKPKQNPNQNPNPTKDEDKKKELTLLVPDLQLATTVAEFPTFLWYLRSTPDPTPARAMEFTLMDNNDGQEIYKTRFAIRPNQHGLMSLKLPNSPTSARLEIGRQYHWAVTLVCNANNLDSNVVIVDGFVQRVKPSPQMVAQSERASLRQQFTLYAENRLWYDMLATLAELRHRNPNDSTLKDAWKKLLESVGLDEIAQEPMFVQSATEIKMLPQEQTNANQ